MKTTKLGHGDFQPQDEPEVSIDFLREGMPELVQAVLDDSHLIWTNSYVCFEHCFNEAMMNFSTDDFLGKTATELKSTMDNLISLEIERQIDAALVYEECLPRGWE